MYLPLILGLDIDDCAGIVFPAVVAVPWTIGKRLCRLMARVRAPLRAASCRSHLAYRLLRARVRAAFRAASCRRNLVYLAIRISIVEH
jgi:hypothetical protein